ncbi:unnamed protein product [Mytilus edulis]|uniref:Reverse transcriptase domain-containing protein n=1 Tax=Mytilus edulis TaxID=6550 RepID=A0A8S3S0B1_MYTED|nr:unnamed protein product [Mytilus edulis]
MDREYYRDSILNMLQDEMSYEVTDKKLDRQTSTMIKKLLKKHETELFKEEIDYISNSKFSESYFYGLPKIHKSEEISNAISEQNSEYIELLTPNDLKFRPIVGGPNSVTQNLSHFIDIVLKPLCREVPSFIRDDLEFLNHLPKTVNPNSELITFDIVSLYTNIPHELGITAVKYWLENTENVIENRLTKEFILASLKLILERNIFYFNGTYYHQKKGTAMETTAFKELSSKLISIHEDLRELINISKTKKIDESKIIETLKRELKISFNIVDEQQAVNSQELLINSSQDINNSKYCNYLRNMVGKRNASNSKKVKTKTIPGEHTDDINIRRENAIRNFEVEIKLLKNKANRYEHNYKKLDEEMFETFVAKFNAEITESINNLWRSDCEKEEIKSVQIWERKQLWLEEYEDHFGDLFVTEENTQVDNAYKRKPFHVKKRKVQRNYPGTSHNTDDNLTNQAVVHVSHTPHTNIQPRNKPKCHQNQNRYSKQTTNANQNNYNLRLRRNPEPHRRQQNFVNDNGTTYIGQNVQNHFLGQRRMNDKGGGTTDRSIRNQIQSSVNTNYEETFPKEIA